MEMTSTMVEMVPSDKGSEGLPVFVIVSGVDDLGSSR